MMLATSIADRVVSSLVKASGPWATVYAHNRGVSTAVLFFHVAPLVFGAGAGSFWLELGLVASLLVNGLLLKRTEQALLTKSDSDSLWHRMRTLSGAERRSLAGDDALGRRIAAVLVMARGG